MFNRRKIEYVDPNSRASDPVGVRLNPDKLRYFREQGWHWLFRWLLRRRTPDEAIGAYLAQGDSRAAVVLQTEPDLILAAYTDEMDAVLLLQFPKAMIEQYELVKGQRLLTINVYEYEEELAPDIVAGPNTSNRYSNFIPLIAEFLSDDLDQIEMRKANIDEAEWKRAWTMGEKALYGGQGIRDGDPYMVAIPAEEER